MSYGYRNYGGPQVSQKPENVLIRAQDLVSGATSKNGEKEKREALRQIHDFISQAKNKRNWNKCYEPMMKFHLSLCVDLKDARHAKDGLHQYRSMVMQSDPMLLDGIITYLMELSESKAGAAKSKADKTANAAAAGEVDDLDALATPKAIMLSSMSDEFAKDRTDREVVVPWLKFLWEIYRAILELLYKNSKLEKTYHRAAEKAFKFCVDYKRNLEFRRLCEMLRSHLIFIQKGVGQVRNGVKQEWLPESREMHLVTRFKQLEAATSLELWNEGFRAVEDIYAINQLVKKSTKAFMISYYQKLTEIFWVSDSPLFHAYAWFKFYSLSRDGNRELSAEKRTAFATATLMATLSLPPTAKAAVEYSGDEDEKNARMATLLDFHANPSRESLLAELERQGVMAHVAPEFQGLFQLMEKKFAPLTFVQNVMPYVQKLQASESLSKYAPVFLQGCVVKLVAQLSTVYSSVKMDFVRKLVAPAGLNFCEVESFLMRAVYKKQLQMRVDHAKGFVYFGTIQAATSAMETQVARFGAAMQRISAKINSESATATKASSEQRAAYLKCVAAAADDVHASALERKAVIERRKEDLEERKQVRIELETVRRMEEEKVRQANEMKRIEEEEANREKDRRSKVFEAQRAEQIKAMLEKSGKNVDLKTIQNADANSRDKMLADARDKFQKDKDNEAQKKIDVAKRLDHITRALRLEGAPKVVSMYESQVAEDKKLYDAKMAEDEQRDREKHALAVKEKERMSRMQAFRAAFEADFLATQKAEFDKHLDAQKAAVERDYYKGKLADARARKQEYDDRIRAEEDAEIARQAQLEEDRLLAEREAVLREQRAEMEAVDRERAALDEEKRAHMKREAEEMRAQRDTDGTNQREAASSDNASSWVKASGGKASAFGGDREEPRRGFGGDRDEPRRGGFGGDRSDDAPRQRSGFGGDRDEPRRGGGFGDRGGDRGGDRDGERPRFGGGGGGGDRDEPRRGGFGDRGGDRDGERPRFGGGDRDGERPRFGGGDRGSDRGGAGDSRFAGKFSSGGSRDDAPREDARFAKFGSGGGSREGGDRGGDRPRETRDVSRW